MNSLEVVVILFTYGFFVFLFLKNKSNLSKLDAHSENDKETNDLNLEIHKSELKIKTLEKKLEFFLLQFNNTKEDLDNIQNYYRQIKDKILVRFLTVGCLNICMFACLHV